jgi:predicted ATP-grasp superfamily ATP-dependent carboligase
MPSAIDEIRKLGQQGHTVVASDTISTAAGSHSKHAAAARVTASPRRETRRFIDDVARILREERIDVVLPAFEEVFYLAKHADELSPFAKLFLSPLETLDTLHDKAKMLDLARRLGVRVPGSALAESPEDLRLAVGLFPEFFARPRYSRGGVDLFTNTGPLAGALAIEQCEVTKDKPWIVQEYVQGTDVCTFSVAHHGRLTGHSAYVHPREIEHAGGIVFESVDEPECLRTVQKIVEETRYHGQISFDFLRTDGGMVLIECNPRPTAGVHVMSPAMLDEALADEKAAKLRVAEPGVRCKYSIALIRDMLLHFHAIPEDARHLFSGAREVLADPDDLLPALYQLISYGHVLKYRLEAHRHGNRTLMAAYFDDICWNGEPIP